MTSPSQIVRRSLANFQKAGNLVAEGRLTEALEPLRQSVQEDPGFPDSLFLLARTERRLALYDQALESLEKYLKRFPADPDVLNEAIESALFSGQPAKVIRLGDQRLAIEPFDGRAMRIWLLVVFFNQGLKPALKALRHCLKKQPDWPDGFLFSGHLQELSGNFAEAEGAYARALELDSQQTLPLEELRRLWRGATLEDNPLRPEYEELFVNEARFLLDQQVTQLSAECIEKWHRQFPERFDLCLQAVVAWERLRQYPRAVECLDRVPEDHLTADLLEQKAQFLEYAGEHSQACDIYRALCENNLGTEDCWQGYARTAAHLPDSKQARAAVSQALEHYPGQPELWFLKASLLKDSNCPPGEIIPALEQCLMQDAHHPAGLYALGIERLLNEQNAEAIPPLGDLVILQPDHLEAWRALAIAYTRSRLWTEALEAWKKVLLMAPGDSQASGNIPKIERYLRSIQDQAASLASEPSRGDNR